MKTLRNSSMTLLEAIVHTDTQVAPAYWRISHKDRQSLLNFDKNNPIVIKMLLTTWEKTIGYHAAVYDVKITEITDECKCKKTLAGEIELNSPGKTTPKLVDVIFTPFTPVSVTGTAFISMREFTPTMNNKTYFRELMGLSYEIMPEKELDEEIEASAKYIDSIKAFLKN